jgi:energy-coupling factor transporter ATP-binding protein EcfA2
VSLFARDRTREPTTETPGTSGVIALRDVVKDYAGPPPVRALHGISVNIADGELAAIVGPSGSGKTTLLHIMGTLDRATSGQDGAPRHSPRHFLSRGRLTGHRGTISQGSPQLPGRMSLRRSSAGRGSSSLVRRSVWTMAWIPLARFVLTRGRGYEKGT